MFHVFWKCLNYLGLKAIFNLNFVTYCTLRTKEKLVMINFVICQERGIFENMKIKVEVSFIDIFLMNSAYSGIFFS